MQSIPLPKYGKIFHNITFPFLLSTFHIPVKNSLPEDNDKCNFYMIFIIILFIKIVSFSLFLLIWFNFYLYLSIHLCFEGMRRFQINLQGLYMQSGLSQLNQTNLHPVRHEFKRRPTQLNSSPIGVRKLICTKSKSNSD